MSASQLTAVSYLETSTHDATATATSDSLSASAVCGCSVTVRALFSITPDSKL